MRILVRGKHQGHLRAASHEFGLALQANQTMNVWFGPDDLDTLSEYMVPDNCPFVTWVMIKHPTWLHEIWNQGTPVVIDDSQAAVLRLQEQHAHN
jgi:hypothetical protein